MSLKISTTVDPYGQTLTVKNADNTYTLPVGGIGHIQVLGMISGVLFERDLTTQEMSDFIAQTDLVLNVATETGAAHAYMPDDFYAIQLTVLVNAIVQDASNQTSSLQFQDIEKAVNDKIIAMSIYPESRASNEAHEYIIFLNGLRYLGSQPGMNREGEAVTRLSYLTLKVSGA